MTYLLFVISLQVQFETTIIETGVMRFMRVNFDKFFSSAFIFAKFIASRCNSIQKVRKSVKKFKPPLDEDLPPEVIQEWEDAKGRYQENDVERYIATFKYVYQQFKAILKKRTRWTLE
jgi:hypothetical protein